MPALLRLLRAADGGGGIVHVQYPAVAFRRNPMINLLPALLRRERTRLTLALTVHDVRVMRRRWRARLTPMLASADAVVYVDPPDGEHLARWTWGNRPLTACIPIGASILPIAATEAERWRWRADLGLPGREPVVAFFGMLYPHKGLDELVQAMETLRGSGTAARLLVIGDFDRRTPFEATLRGLFEPGEREGWLVWLRGANEEAVSRALWAADAAALPFHSGAASNRSSLLVALGHGLPTVTTRGPATPPDFERHYAATLVPPRSPAALAQALAALLRSARPLPERVGPVAAVPSWDEVGERHVELYARLDTRRVAA